MRSLPAWAYEAALLATVLVWGINFAVIKLALAELPPYVVNALRFAVSAVALGLAHWATSRPLPEAEGGDGRGRSRFWLPMQVAPWRIVGLGLLGYVGYQVSFILGVNLTTAGTAGLIIGSAPALTALFARLFGIERLSPAAWAGLADQPGRHGGRDPVRAARGGRGGGRARDAGQPADGPRGGAAGASTPW